MNKPELDVYRPDVAQPDELPALLARLVETALRAAPGQPVAVNVRVGNVRLSVGTVESEAPPPAPPDLTPIHADDFSWVRWQGVVYKLSPMQRRVVARLWQCWEKGEVDVAQKELLDAAGSDSSRLIEIFRRTPAWGKLVVSHGGGRYRLGDVGTEHRGRTNPVSYETADEDGDEQGE